MWDVHSSHVSAHICASASYICISGHFKARHIAKSNSQRGTRPQGRSASESGAGGAAVPGTAGRPGRGEGSRGRVSPLRGAPREPPPAAADGRWQQTAGNGRAPQRGGGTGGTARRGAALALCRLIFILLNKQAGEGARRGAPPGAARTPPRLPPTHRRCTDVSRSSHAGPG